ncbi:MAG: hypothetical protein QME94_10350, partial [Anaerolineae bacterium]|nr:hypothetical protein [Anaerolineae bacterium]
CSAPAAPGDAFCQSCGSPLTPRPAAPPPPSPMPPPGSFTPAPAAAPPPRRSPVLWIVAAIGLLVVLCLCASVVWVWPKLRQAIDEGTAAVTRVPGIASAPTPARATATAPSLDSRKGQVLFADDFADNDAGWDEGVSEVETRRFLEGGSYHIEVVAEDMASWSTASEALDLTDFVLEVDATPVAGPDDNGYGVLFRYVDGENFYYFEISSDGYYHFRSNENDEWVQLIKWTRSDAIKQGKQRNRITVLAEGDHFEFQLNGQRVATYEDDSFASGTIGLIAATGEEGGVHIAFDNLRVYELR